MTQQELARRAGMDFTTISKIEKGSLTGSLNTHQKIAKALNISLLELYKGLSETESQFLQVNKTQDQNSEVFYYNDKVISQILVKQIGKHKMVPELLRIEKNSQTHLEQKPAGIEQFAYVLEGNIEIKVADTAHKLKKGESIYFDASKPHIIKNLSNKTAKCLRVTSPGAL